MRALLDIITRILKELTKNQNIPHSFHQFTDKYEVYSKFNPEFFNDIFQEKLKKFINFKNERDGLLHGLHSFFFSPDVEGNLAFDIRERQTQTLNLISIKKFKDGKISEYLEILDYIINNNK